MTPTTFCDTRRLDDGWTLLLTDAGAFNHPRELPATLSTIPAIVPGTVAAALEAASQFDRNNPQPLNNRDAWYRISLRGEAPGPVILRFAGLATIADIYINHELLLSTESMFEHYELPVVLTGQDELAICFRALAPHLDKAGPRARWRPQMISARGLRLIRTTLLGYMPGWCPEIHASGPWRPVTLTRPGAFRISGLEVHSRLEPDGTGVLKVSLDIEGEADKLSLICDGRQCGFDVTDDRHVAELRLPDIEPWWPHTHGTPHLHDVTITIDGQEHSLGKTGFRRIEARHGDDGRDFVILINGQRIFCRGAVWTNADIVRLPGERAAYEPWLRLAAEAGMNMIRIGGTMAYETAEFFQLCDELGIMVWQDLMLANFDYPAKDAGFVEHLSREVSQFLAGVQMSPSLTVLCGGSEVYQQGAMLGLPEAIWKGSLAAEILPRQIAGLRADVSYVENSPSGGALPFFPDSGVAHYYGVGAYCRPLEDARRASVRFAAECLAFANVPQQKTLDDHLPVQPVHDPRWKARVPRDRGASWDFEDIRDHYLQELYGLDAARLRREQPTLYLDLSRAVSGEVIEATFAEWRRAGSSCNGALIWTFQDLMSGPGWGLIDSTGTPKPVWYAAKRAFRPVQVMLVDEGTNGLDIHVVNETSAPRDVVLDIACLRNGSQPVVSGRRELILEPRQTLKIPATDLFGAFFDTTYAYRFGPPAHDATMVRLLDGQDSSTIADAFHFPQGRRLAMREALIEASISEDNGNWWLELRTDGLAQSVHIDIAGYRPDDDWFHLAPGKPKRVRLIPDATTDTNLPPSGTISTPGGQRITRV